jgi:hypothetical protein
MSDEPENPAPPEPAAPTAPEKPAEPPKPEDPNAGLKKAIAEERRRAKVAEDEKTALAAKLKEFEDKELSAQQKAERDLAELKAQAEAARQEAAAAQLDALRHRIAAEKQVPAALLTGADEESLTASADAALKWRGAATPEPPKAPKPDPSVGPRGGDGVKSLQSGADLYDARHPRPKSTV